MQLPPTTPKPRGFAAISPERQREIAALGGKAIPAHKRSFARDPSLAARAGSLGGSASQASRKAKP